MFNFKAMFLTPYLLLPNLITGNLHYSSFTVLLLQLLVKLWQRTCFSEAQQAHYYITSLCDYRTTNQNGLGRFAVIKFPTGSVNISMSSSAKD